MTYVLNKDEVKEEFFKIKKIGHYDVNVTEYINRDKMFEHAFNSLKPHISDWIENIEDPQQVKNMKADKEHALHHFLAKREFPTGYTDDVGVEVIGDEMLEYHGLTVDEYIQKTLNRGDNVFERLYCEVIMEFIDLQDDNVYEFMNKSDLLKEYIQYLADRRLERLGLAAHYHSENPFPWMSEVIDLKKEKNFFETRVTEYQTGGALEW